MTTRIVLTEPFIRHPAGLVFELDEATSISGWEEDDRLRERMSFLGKETYYLPDGGNGAAYDLRESATAPCPPEIFENEDLRSGPCRLTRAAFQQEGATNEVWNAGFGLFEVNGVHAQGFEFPIEKLDKVPSATELHDVLRNELIRSLPTVGNRIDCSDLMPGFYQVRLLFPQGVPFYISLIKSFPLLVFFSDRPKTRYTVQKTLY